MDPITNKEDYYYQMGEFYFHKKKYKKAIQAFKKGLIINSNSIMILYELGMCYVRLEENRKAASFFKKVKKLAPHSIPASLIKENIEYLL